ncbi:MAG: cytochrome c [Polyangiales bacterium]
MAPWGALLGLTLAACDQTPPATRTWTAEDHAHAPGSVPTGQTPAAQVDDGLSSEERTARSVFLVACAGCHGPAGHGDGPERAPVMRLPDFASATWQASRTDDELMSIISLGRGMMPAFGDRIPADGLRALVAHIRRFAPQAAPADTRPPADGGVGDTTSSAPPAATAAD